MKIRGVARSLIATAAAASLTLGVVACSKAEETAKDVKDSASSAASAGKSAAESATKEASWPRTITTLDGNHQEKEVTIEEQPKNIYATSVTLAGNLLAIDAPVKNIAVQGKGNAVADERGFFKQWAEEADAAGAQVGYEREPNVEAILAAKPDLVVMSSSGQDSATAVYDQLADVVPVVVVDYSDKTWQDVVEELGEATGHEQQAEDAIKKYEDKVKEVSEAINKPEQPVNILSLGKGGKTINAWTNESAQGRMLEDLGWEIAIPEESLVSSDGRFKGRADVKELPEENYAPGLTGKTILAINADGKSKPSEVIKGTAQLKDNEAVKANTVYDMPAEFFRIDYFSAIDSLDAIKELFKK